MRRVAQLLLLFVMSISARATDADAAPEALEASISALNQPMSSHDGSWFGQLSGDLSYSPPVVTSADGTVTHAGTFVLLDDVDLDAVAPSIVLWRPDEPLPAGTYTVTFELQTATLVVDPALDLELAFEELTVTSQLLTTQNGAGSSGTSCCATTECGADSACRECWTTYNFLNATGSVPVPTFPNSLAVRAEYGQGAETNSNVFVSAGAVTTFGDFAVDAPICVTFGVFDSSFAELQTEERCGEIPELPAEDELVVEQPVPATCTEDPCVLVASSVDPDAMADCPDVATNPEPAGKASPGCGCASAPDATAAGPMLLLIGLLAFRRCRRDILTR